MKSIYSAADNVLREQPSILGEQSCRVIPCSENNNFEDGKLYEEGKDYRLHMGVERLFAYQIPPIQPITQSEDELFEEAFDNYSKETYLGIEEVRVLIRFKNWLKSRYTIHPNKSKNE